MNKKTLLSLLLGFMCMTAQAQKITVSGTVMEADTKEPVFSASVVLLNPDSTMAVGASSKMDGKFTLPAVKAGKYIFRVTYVGLKPYFKNLQLTSSQKNVAVGTINMETNAVVLKGAEVTARVAQVEMKADTFVYNSAAYRVPEGSMLEELVRKLPGAEVEEDGTIKINGKEVKKIMVDGKEFFDSDKGMAMKNLPVSMVEKIKAYDRQSDYTRMTGIDDGEEETVLDLSVKKDMKQGWISNIDLGYGTEDRYTGKAIVNRFTDRLRLSVIGSMNNVNDRGFPGGGFRGGGGGLVASKMAGVDFNWENGKKDREAGQLKVGGNVRYNYNGTDRLSTSNSEMFLTSGNGSSFSNSSSKSKSSRQNVNANFRVEWSPDSMTRIMFRPNFSYSQNFSRSANTSVTFNEDPYLKMTNPLEEYMDFKDDGTVVNDNQRNSYSEGNNRSLDGMLMVNRRLNTKGRNITLRMNGGYSDSENNSWSRSAVNYFLQNNNNRGESYTRQYNVNPSKKYNASADLSYSEPLFAGAHLQFSYRFQYRYSDSDRSMYSLESLIDQGILTREDLENNYPLQYVPGVDWLDLSKNYENSQYATYKEYNHNASVMFRYIKGELRVNAGVSVQPQKTDMDYMKGSLDTTVTRNVLNWAPRVDVRYKFSETSHLNFRYNGRASQPSMTNLLDVTDDSDPLNISKGNPGLKPSWSDNFSLFYNNYITEKQRGWMVNADGRITRNSISTAVLYDPQTGARTTMPMNINGNWNTNGRVMFSTALDKNKYFNFSTFSNVGYSNSVGYISSDYMGGGNVTSDNLMNLSRKATTKSTTLGERLNVNFRNDLLEVGVNGDINYQHARNALQENANLDTYSFSYGANATINFPWNMSLSTDIGESSRRGYDDATMNTNELIWNAQLSQSFLKQNAATVSVQWYDILRERSNISRSLSAVSRTDSWSNAINSYVMVHFIYKLNLLGNKNARSEMRGFGGDFGSGGGRGPGGRSFGFGGPR